MEIKRRYIYPVITVSVTLFFVFFNNYLNPPEKSISIKSGWTVEYNNTVKDIDKMPYYKSGDRDADFKTGIYSFRCRFILKNKIEEALFFIPFIAGNGIKVYIDDIYIGQQGDLKEGNASIWNKAQIYSFPKTLSSGSHEIKIIIYGLYEVGILKTPFIQSKNDGIFRKQFLFFYFQYLIEIISGMLIFLSIIFIATGLITHENSHINFFMGLFLISIFLFILDYSFIDYLFIKYLVFKKISFAGISLAMIFLIILINKIFRIKNGNIDKIIILVNSLILLAGIFIPDNMIELRRIYSKTHLFIILILIYISVKIFRTKQKSVYTELLLTGLMTVFFISGYDIVQLFLHTGTVFYTHIGLIIFTILVSAIALNNIIEIHTLAALEKGRAEEFHKDSITDSLTGIYNRRIINVLDELITEIYSVIIIDMNDFKIINDTYGHNCGDIVLKKAADIIQETTRAIRLYYQIRRG